MQYLGGKVRLAARLREAILANTRARSIYIEPFMGGCSVLAEMSPAFERSYGYDIHPGLVNMWNSAVLGWIPPPLVSEEEYKAARTLPDNDAVKAFIGFACSFGGKWFGGYARHNRPDGFAARGSKVITSRARKLKDNRVTMASRDYRDLAIGSGEVIYCDPPYADSTKYAYCSGFDSGVFWDTAQSWANLGAIVFVSEYCSPLPTAAVVAEFPHKCHISNSTGSATGRPVEKLFLIAGIKRGEE